MQTNYGEKLRYQEKVAIGPGSLPVHRDFLKQHAHLELDINDEDGVIDGYIRDAVQAVEQDSGRALVMQTRKLYLDRWPMSSESTRNRDPESIEDVELRGCPVSLVQSVRYTDDSGVVQTWSPSAYQVNTDDEPCRLRYSWGGYWPSARLQERSICVTYKCGYVIPIVAVDKAGDVITLAGWNPVNGQMFRVSNSGGSPGSSGLPGGLSLMTDYYVIAASGSTCKLSLTEGGDPIDLKSEGTGLNFLGEVNPLAIQAIYLRVAMNCVDKEGADYETCKAGYWAKIHGLRYEGW